VHPINVDIGGILKSRFSLLKLIILSAELEM